jgi:hypothetical protein
MFHLNHTTDSKETIVRDSVVSFVKGISPTISSMNLK